MGGGERETKRQHDFENFDHVKQYHTFRDEITKHEVSETTDSILFYHHQSSNGNASANVEVQRWNTLRTKKADFSFVIEDTNFYSIDCSFSHDATLCSLFQFTRGYEKLIIVNRRFGSRNFHSFRYTSRFLLETSRGL